MVVVVIFDDPDFIFRELSKLAMAGKDGATELQDVPVHRNSKSELLPDDLILESGISPSKRDGIVKMRLSAMGMPLAAPESVADIVAALSRQAPDSGARVKPGGKVSFYFPASSKNASSQLLPKTATVGRINKHVSFRR